MPPKDLDFSERDKERGTVLIVTLVVIVSLLTIAYPSLFKLMTYYKVAEKSHRSLAAVNLAEAGVDRAIWEINFGDINSWIGNSQSRSLTIDSVTPYGGEGYGSILINVQDPLGANPVIESVGSILYRPPHPIERKIRVVLEERVIPFFDYGVFGDESVTVAPNIVIQGDVGTNSTGYGAITIESNSEVYGDVTCGPGADTEVSLQIEDNSTVYGLQESAEEAKGFPSVTAPDELIYRGDYEISHTTETLSEDGRYSDFNINQNSELQISGDVTLHVTGEFRMGSNTELVILDGGSLTLYISGSVDMDSNCYVYNNNEDPTKLKFYGTDSLTGIVNFSSNTAFYGSIYLPRADLIISSNIDLYGSAYGKTVELNANVYLAYQEGQEDFSEMRFALKSWQQIISQGQ